MAFSEHFSHQYLLPGYCFCFIPCLFIILINVLVHLFTCLWLINCLWLCKWPCPAQDRSTNERTPSRVRHTTEQKPGSPRKRQTWASTLSKEARNRCLQKYVCPVSTLDGPPLCSGLADSPSVPFRAGGRGRGCKNEAVPCQEDTGDVVRLGYLQFVAPEGCLLGKGTPDEAALGGYCTAEAECGSEEGRPGFLLHWAVVQQAAPFWRIRSSSPSAPKSQHWVPVCGAQSGQPAGRGAGP